VRTAVSNRSGQPSIRAGFPVGTAVRLILGLIAGAMVGAFGTAIHRSLLTFGAAPNTHFFPHGLLLALALTIAAGLFIRASAGFNTFAAFGLGWIVMVQLLAMPNTGGDVLIVDPREPLPFAAAGLIWTYLGAVLLVLLALLPPRWFRAMPSEPTGPTPREVSPAGVFSAATVDPEAVND